MDLLQGTSFIAIAVLLKGHTVVCNEGMKLFMVNGLGRNVHFFVAYLVQRAEERERERPMKKGLVMLTWGYKERDH